MNIISTILKAIIKVIGNVSMGTSASTITGAIAEHETQITSLQNKPAFWWSLISTGSQTWASGSTTYTATIPGSISGYYRWVFGLRATSRYLTLTWRMDSSDNTALIITVYNSHSSAVTAYVSGIAVYINTDLALT